MIPPNVRRSGTLMAFFAAGVIAGYFLPRGGSSTVADTTTAPHAIGETSAALQRSAAPPMAVGAQQALADQTKAALETSSAAQGDQRHEAFVGRAAATMLVGSDARRHREFLALLDEMKPEDARAVHRLLASSMAHGILYEQEWEAFWTRWGELDGGAAMAFSLSLSHEAVPKDVRRIMRGWGASDPEAAAQWLEEHQEKQFTDALAGLADGFAARDLRGATALVLEAAPPGDPQLAKVMEVLAEQAFRQGRRTTLLAWFEQLPRDGGSQGARAAAFDHVFWRIYRANPYHAMEWVRTQSTESWRKDRIIARLATEIGAADPVKAVQWLETVPPADDGSYPGLSTVIRRWRQSDRAGLERWLGEDAAGAVKEQALAAVAEEAQKQAARTAPAAEFQIIHRDGDRTIIAPAGK